MTQSTISAQAIAKISYEDESFQGLTQPYAVISNGIEVFRHATYAGCERFIRWHGYELAQNEQETAQAELDQFIEQQAQEIAPEIEIDGVESEDFGTVYRVWNSYHFLGSFYQNHQGKWVVEPANTDCRQECDTEYQAQLVILAIQGLVVPKGLNTLQLKTASLLAA